MVKMDMVLCISDVLAPVFASHKVKKAVLFGSCGKETSEPDSDVDIWVDSRLMGAGIARMKNAAREAKVAEPGFEFFRET
jgi:predicted nucleotidyltransferase